MAGRYDALFDQESLREIQEFFDTRDRWRDILEYRQLSAEVGHVKNLFYGDSITDIWPLHEFFPNHSVLNRAKQTILDKTRAVASMIREHGSRVYLGSILPLRSPDAWDRFQYQDKIVEINEEQREWSLRNLDGFLDYHSRVKDASGQLAAEFARPDGTHLTFAAYRVLSDVVRPYLA